MNEQTYVLIHGFAFDMRTWDPLELAFEGHRRMPLSLPGFGSAVPTKPYSIRELANDFWQQLDDAGISSVHLLGHSMGGYVCLEMLALQPSRVLSLALLHSHVFADTEEKKAARTTSVAEINAGGASAFAKRIIPTMFSDAESSRHLISKLVHRSTEYSPAAWSFGTIAMRDRNDHTETLKNMTQPVLFLMGEKDKAVPSDIALKQALINPNSEMQLYPNAGHMSMYENTHQVISDLIAFYDRIGS